MKIKTNHHWHPFLSFYDLSLREQRELGEERNEETFVRYYGSLYSLSEFVRFDSPWMGGAPQGAEGWHGMADYGIVIKLNDDCDACQIGTLTEEK